MKLIANIKKGWKYVLFCIFLINQSYGQAKPSGSVANAAQIKTADSLFNLAEKKYESSDLKQAFALFGSCLPIYQNLEKQEKIGDCYSYIGYINYLKGDYSKALSFFKKSTEAFKKAKNKKAIANALNNIGAAYYSIGNYSRAVEYYKQAITVQEEIGAKKNMATITANIAGIYSKIKDYTNALKYINKANAVFKELNDQHGIAKVLIETGYISMKQGDFANASKDLNQSLAIAEKEKDVPVKIEVLSVLGELYYDQSDFKKASFYYNLCLQNAKEAKNLRYIGISQIEIGNVFHRVGRNKEATGKCEAGLEIAKKLKAVELKKDACECLYRSYKALKNDRLALGYHEKIRAFEDSLQIKETSNKVINMEFQKQQLVDSIAFVKQQSTAQLKHQAEIQAKEKQRNLIIVSLGIMLLVAVGLWSRLSFVRKSKEALKLEKDRSEALLLNILPEEIAEELKATGSVKAKDFGLVSILFTDFKSFTQTAEKMSPQSLVEEINVCFKAFDLISEKYQIEKIKTIGDAYMAAGGISNSGGNSLKNSVLAGLEMQEFVMKRFIENQQTQKPSFEMRLGIHAGPIVAGIVGVKKFQYDVWGDTVNTASRMESNGSVGKVNISQSLYELLKDEACFTFEYRGSIDAKGKGEINMYFVEKNGSVPA